MNPVPVSNTLKVTTDSVSILITGSELLDGRVLDTNTRFVAEELAARHLTLKRVLVVDDDLLELRRGLEVLSEVSTFILISGGMGPTSDDLTREASAEFLGQELVENHNARQHLEAFYTKRKRALDSTNLKQAFIPNKCELIPNPVGTAPGFIGISGSGVHIAALPGVPSEFTAMFNQTLLPYIERLFKQTQKLTTKGFRVFGIPEGEVGRLIQGCTFPESVKVSYRAAFPEVHVKLKSFISESELANYAQQASSILGSDFIFTHELSQTLVEILRDLLVTRNLTVSVAESCSGGMLGELFTTMSGSSAYFLGGVIAYHNEVKVKELGVKPVSLEKHGAVSSEVASEMATGIRFRINSSIGLSITGIAGPDGGTTEKPVGTFFVGIASAEGTKSFKFFYPSDRYRIRKFSAYTALDVLRRQLLDLEVRSYVSKADLSGVS